MSEPPANESGPHAGHARAGEDGHLDDAGEFTASEPTAKPRALLLGRDGRELPEVPRRDPLNVLAFSVRPRGKRTAEVHVACGDRFVFSGVVKDTGLEEFVASFALAHPIYRGREAELVALLRARWAVETSAYTERMRPRGRTVR